MIAEVNSLYELFEAFPDEQTCIDHLAAIRWRDGKSCPHCGSLKVYDFSDRRTFKCGECRQRFSVKVGTIFEDTKLPLRKWYIAIWMITNHPKGIASTTLAKELKITQKSAWFVMHRLRHALRTKSFNAPLKGTVEAETTYVGGNERNKHSGDRKGGTQGGAGKKIVLRIIERGGELRRSHVSDGKGTTLNGHIFENVSRGSTILTDDDRAFRSLRSDYYHHTANHSVGEYVRHFTLHTNGIESVWAMLKRQIVGVHHWISRKHLDKYVREMTWCFTAATCV